MNDLCIASVGRSEFCHIERLPKAINWLQRAPLGILCATFTEYFPILLPSVTVRLKETATDVTIYRGAGTGGFMNIWTASWQATKRRKPKQTYSGQGNNASRIKDNCVFKWCIQKSRIRVQNGQWIVIKNLNSIAFGLPLIEMFLKQWRFCPRYLQVIGNYELICKINYRVR
jgi:hypothetical protein